MELSLCLSLPRDGVSVPVARGVVDASLRVIGVMPEDVNDVSVSLAEACTNVLDHSGPGDEYLLELRVDGAVCVIVVTDVGRGVDVATLPEEGAAGDAEHGRGMQLMRALVDKVAFTSAPGDGSVVRLEKHLELRPGSLLAQATDSD